MCVLPYNTKQWQAFFRLMQRPDMCDDPRVVDPAVRSEKIGELYEAVAELVATWETGPLLEALELADIPNGAATALGDLPADPHLEDVGLFQEFDHPTEGRIRLAGPGVKFSETPPAIDRLPAALGQDSHDVLGELGYSDTDIAKMVSEGATLDGRPGTSQAADD